MRALDALSQVWPPSPKFTEKDLPDLNERVCIVTGANTGIGYEISRILYSKNATVYAAGRSEEKVAKAINTIRQAHPSSTGRIVYLHLDLSDLTTIKASANAFLAEEKRLHLLFNNAGVMTPPDGAKTAQGYELQLGTNCLGPFLFTKLLVPVLAETARTAQPNSVRVIWVSSSVGETLSPRGGVEMDNLDYKRDKNSMQKYAVSKAGNYYHATEFARRHVKDGIISVALNPGNLWTDLDRNSTGLFLMFRKMTTFPPIYGAYTELFASLSPDITIENSGSWIVPWGRFLPIRNDMALGTKPESEGGTGTALQFWEWSEKQVGAYI